jgi:hypothetical protein
VTKPKFSKIYEFDARRMAAKRPEPKNPLGYRGPWAWAFEPVRGCNLACGHCAARLIRDEPYQFIEEETFRAIVETMAVVTPKARVDFAQCGEPTLHPQLLDFLSIARDVSPWTQYQVTTNGIRIRKGEVRINDLFEAGANIVYVDMYGGPERYYELALEAAAKDPEIDWFFYHPEYHKDEYDILGNRPETSKSPWTYVGPDRKTLVLMDPPEDWPKSRFQKGRLGSFFNHLDFEAGKKFEMYEVTEPVAKSCVQLERISVTDFEGNYILCCQDFTGETAGTLGNVFDGPEGWYRFWLGETMQRHRRLLRDKNRAASPYCSRCDITYSTRIARMFTDEDLSWYLDEDLQWRKLR